MARDYEPTFCCAHCLDTGWRPFRCDGGQSDAGRVRDAHLPVYTCGRKATHAPHGYVERCGCWATNVALKREWDRTHRAPKEAA
jgi:hypothetical protein